MPRSPRLLAPWVGQPGAGPAIYHCVSRVVNRAKVFGASEKDHFVRLMRRYEAFCGVRILTYCVMSNHFHLLVEVPPRPELVLSDQELCERLLSIKSVAEVEAFSALLQRARESGNETVAEDLRERFLYRMWDLGEFMKSLKQCFTTWFNERHGRCGTLWESRYKNTLVEDGYAARIVAAYIDLNPIRAGLVKRPERFRWCGYAEAVVKRSSVARAGLVRLMHDTGLGETERAAGNRWRFCLGLYRSILFRQGEERYRQDPRTGEVEVAKRGFVRREVEEVLRRGGTVSPSQALRSRVQALSDGAVVGSRRFLEKFFASRERCMHPSRGNVRRALSPA